MSADSNDNNTIENKSNNEKSRSQPQRGAGKRKRKRLDPFTSRVVVVGAGLAGLSTALSLRKAGFRNVCVYEKDPSLEYQKEGYGLTLTYNPKGPLADLGVLETVAQRDCPSRSHYLFRQDPPGRKKSSSLLPTDEQPPTESGAPACVSSDDSNQTTTTETIENEIENDTAFPMGYFGNAFFGSSTGNYRRGYGQRGNLRVPRKVLRRILYDELLRIQQEQEREMEAVGDKDADGVNSSDTNSDDKKKKSSSSVPEAVYWNRALLDFRWDGTTQQYHLQFETHHLSQPSNGCLQRQSQGKSEVIEATADLLVAADGIRSSVLQKLYIQKLVQEPRRQPKSESEDTLCNDNIAPNTSAIPTTTRPSQGQNPLPTIREQPELYGLRPMGIRMILGIADGIDHPLLRERGFYTIDTHGHRLFTMPYVSSRFDGMDDVKNIDGIQNNNNNNSSSENSAEETGSIERRTKKKNRIMWQLSFSTPINPNTLDSAFLCQYVLETFHSWHPPALDLVRSTPPASIWGTDLMDRDPRAVYRELIVGTGGKGSIERPRLVVCGDALHSMSPFKGQGANQALADGPLLARWLSKSSIDAALTNWWRETLNRTVPVVEASRKAAIDWHNPDRILGTTEEDHKEYHGFAGVEASSVPELVEILRKRKVGPHLGGQLDQTVREVIREHGWFEQETMEPEVDVMKQQPQERCSAICERVLELASAGDTAGLRKMSLPSSSTKNTNLKNCAAMVDARDKNGRSCLHLAAIGNHWFTCVWLLVELKILEQWKEQHHVNKKSPPSHNTEGRGPKDEYGKTAFDYAFETGNKNLANVFETVLQGR